MAILLPLLGFIGLWIYSGNTRREPNWRAAFIQALILWGAWLVLSTEFLSLICAIHKIGVSISWGILVLINALWLIFWLRKGSVLRLPVVYHSRGREVALLDVVLSLVILVPLVVGFIAPPNSSEAMDFGMSRVAHWAQNESMQHFAAGNEALNNAPPGAGYAILNFYVLTGSDRWSNFPAWVAFLGCVEAAMAIAGLFGATPAGQRLSAVVATSIPTGLALASGSLDDLPSCLWVMAFILIVFFVDKDKNLEFNLMLAAVAAGLAFITKPLTLVFIVPFGLYLFIVQLRRQPWFHVLAGGLIGLLIVALLAGGFIGRNFATYGTAYDIDAYFSDLNETITWKTALSNVLRNFALHANLPFSQGESWIERKIIDVHERIGIDVNDPQTTRGGKFEIPVLNTSEQTSGNPFHWLVIMIASLVVVGAWLRKKSDRTKITYLGLMLASYIAFVVLLKWRPTGSRWHLTFFVMSAPIVGIVLGWLDQKQRNFGAAMGFLMLLVSLPWLVAVQERPLIPIEPYTYPKSILKTPRESLYFTTVPNEERFYREVAERVLAEPPQQHLSLVFDTPFLEYPVWALTRNVEGHTEIEYHWVTGASQKYLKTALESDFILTNRCLSAEAFPGFEIELDSGLDKCLYVAQN